MSGKPKLRTKVVEEPNCFVVYLCGCTDCFPWAIFKTEDEAIEWAEEKSRNPEGYIIEENYMSLKVGNDEW